jgi:Tol biopolymer transport system component
LFRIGVDGTGLQRLTGPLDGVGDHAENPSWSPDGEAIVFNTPSFDETRKARLTLTDPMGESFEVVWRALNLNFAEPEWSSGSSTIVFSWVSPNSVDRNANLWSIQRDRTELTQLTFTRNRNEYSPAFSPDGTMIASIVNNL